MQLIYNIIRNLSGMYPLQINDYIWIIYEALRNGKQERIDKAVTERISLE